MRQGVFSSVAFARKARRRCAGAVDGTRACHLKYAQPHMCMTHVLHLAAKEAHNLRCDSTFAHAQLTLALCTSAAAQQLAGPE
jgi:hypothetical protein